MAVQQPVRRPVEHPVPPVRDEMSAPLPAWPVTVLFWGTPLWWVTGLFSFAPVIMAVPMLVLLIMRANLRVVPGILPWFAFVLWTVPSILVSGLDLGALGFAVRLAQFTSAGILLLYVVKAPSLTTGRLLAALSAMWLSVVVLGYVAMVFPEVQLSLTIGRLLPDSVSANEYVHDLVFPQLAEVQTPYGASAAYVRPAAPFAYTNGWGAAIAVLTPAVVALAIRRYTLGAMMWLTLGLALAVVPAIATTNRGLFLTLAISLVYVSLRLVGRGRVLPFVQLVLVGGVGVWLLAVLGLFAKIADRQASADTTQGRSNLYVETFQRTIDSPILGFGTPQPSRTSEITVGTQGMVWNVMFCFGFVGLFLFLIFLVGLVWRTWKAPSPAALALHSALVGSLAMSVYYGMDRVIVPIMAIAGLMLRECRTPGSDLWRPMGRRRRAEA